MTAKGAGRLARPIAVATALISFGPLAVAGGAGAASVTSLSARADQIAASVESDQGRLGAIGASYVVESSALDVARQHEVAARAAAAVDSEHIASDRASLRASAITAYVEAGSASALGLYLTSGTANAATGSAYLNAASGELAGHISTLATDEHRLDTLDATARSEAGRAAAALSKLGSDRAAALAALASERSALASARGQLAALVEARAAAAARRAEQAAAAAAARAAAANAASAAAAENAGPPAVSTVLTAAPTATAPAAVPAGSLAAAFQGIRNCESSGNYSLDTGNGYYGAYQFSASTWAGLGGSGLPSAAAPSAQDAAAYRLYQQDGFAAWPECAAILGL